MYKPCPSPRRPRRQSATKQMSLCRLPPLLCLHLKRFEQLPGGVARKLEDPVSFPDSLDLRAYTSAGILAQRYGLKAAARGSAGGEGDAGPSARGDSAPEMPAASAAPPRGSAARGGAAAAATGKGAAAAGKAAAAAASSGGGLSAVKRESGDRQAACSAAGAARTIKREAEEQRPGDSQPDASLYRLFGVVTHRGSMRGGHYVSYVRCEGGWYKCDDAYVTRVDASVVARAQAYMVRSVDTRPLLGVWHLRNRNVTGLDVP